jgi:crotonyl-CoA reductase
VQHILDAILAGDTSSEDFANLELPSTYRAAVVRKDEVDMFEGVTSKEKDPRKSLHVDEVDLPELGPGEAIVAVMASAINYNTVWTSIFEPMPTFGFLERYGRISPLAKRHDLPYHIVGSDLAGVVLKTGLGVHSWNPGDEVVAHCLSVELESPDGHNDTMMDPEQRIWGFETNFGGLAQLALVKSNQLMPKPDHLTWEEAASPGLVNSTAYRQLVSRNGAGMKQGDNVLIWRTPRTPRSGAAWARTSASSPAERTSTSSSSTPAERPSAPRSSLRARAARSSPAPPRAATCTSTTTATCG